MDKATMVTLMDLVGDIQDQFEKVVFLNNLMETELLEINEIPDTPIRKAVAEEKMKSLYIINSIISDYLEYIEERKDDIKVIWKE